MSEDRLHREGCEDTIHLDGAHRLDKIDGAWHPVNMTRKQAIELCEKNLEFYKRRVAILREILELT